LEDVWGVLQERYPEIPDTVIVLGTGVKGAKLHKWGHWLPKSWKVDSVKTGEFLLAGEALAVGPEKVMEIVKHEATHALAESRSIVDTSRNGRFHNKKFADLAEEMGLKAVKWDPYGWAATEYTPLPQDDEMLAYIKEALILERPFVAKDPEEDSERKKSIKTECGCPRKLRLSQTQMEDGPITCGVCNEDFIEVL
jgi:hypothetical protein